MAEKVGVAIAGCGNMGKTHARLLSTFGDVHLSVLVDVNEDAALALLCKPCWKRPGQLKINGTRTRPS